MSVPILNDWREVERLKPHGALLIRRPGWTICGPLHSVEVQADDEVFITTKWLAELVMDRYGRPIGPWRRMFNHPVNFDNTTVPFAVAEFEGAPVIRFGSTLTDLLFIDRPVALAPETVADLALDEDGREPSLWGIKVPGLLRVDQARLLQHSVRRGDVVNDFPGSWVHMLFQGVKAYLGDDSFPGGHGARCNEEFRIEYRLEVEPHLVAHGVGDHLGMTALVAEALEAMAAAWGGVKVEWSDWEEYGVSRIILSRLLNAFAGGSPDGAKLLGFDHPSKLNEAEAEWSGNSYLLERYLADQIRVYLDRDRVAAHLEKRGVSCPRWTNANESV